MKCILPLGLFSRFRLLLCLLLLAMWSGCGYAPVSEKTQLVDTLDSKYKNQGLSRQSARSYLNQYRNWYLAFNNNELNSLIRVALDRNSTLKQSADNLRAAAYAIGAERVNLLPTLAGTMAYDRDFYSSGAKKRLGKAADTSGQLALGLAANYELDLWGKNYSLYKGSLANLQASAEDLLAARISVTASMVNLWINLMALREEIAVVRKQLFSAKGMLELQENGYSNSSVKFSDVLLQRSKIINLQNKLVSIKNAQNATLRSMNLLLGRDPLSVLNIRSKKLPKVAALPSFEINVRALAERPDVKAAFFKMIGAKWKAKAANLSRLPSISFGLNWQFGVDHFKVLLDSWVASLAANLAMPIFRSGELYGQAKAAQYVSEASFLDYQDTVLNAINDCANALSNEMQYQIQIKGIKQQLELTSQSLSTIMDNYLSGNTSYMAWINAADQKEDIELSLIDAKKNFLLNRVVFYKSI